MTNIALHFVNALQSSERRNVRLRFVKMCRSEKRVCLRRWLCDRNGTSCWIVFEPQGRWEYIWRCAYTFKCQSDPLASWFEWPLTSWVNSIYLLEWHCVWLGCSVDFADINLGCGLQWSINTCTLYALVQSVVNGVWLNDKWSDDNHEKGPPNGAVHAD